MALLARLAARGVTAAVVSRGHGGSLPGPVQVDPRRHSAAEVGDEPLMLAALAPVFVGRDRAAAARAAVESGAQAILLDDGFQDPALAHDLSLVVVDAARGFGFSHCYLETLRGMDAAMRLYERSGFRRIDAPLGATGHGGCNRFYLRDL